ncbi:MAG: 3-hydroxyacyl-CoA dehydrogenase family protein [Planctomycetota bacterium]
MNAKDINKAAVLGAGTMGHGIAQMLGQWSIETRLFDVDGGSLEKGISKIGENLAKGVQRGKIPQDIREKTLSLVSGTTDFDEAVAGCDVVIEAVPEKIELKRSLFEKLGDALPATTLLATNTSSLSITQIAEAAKHPERVVGMHFFNPVHIMKLVEVVETELSSEEAVTCAIDLATRIAKEPIRVKDSPGFASSRLGIAIGLEAIRMLEDGVASAEDIDKAMTLGYGFPMGPLRLTDLVGLDTRLSIAEYLSKEVGERFAPPALLRAKVAEGHLGKKSGQGFYLWD